MQLSAKFLSKNFLSMFNLYNYLWTQRGNFTHFHKCLTSDGSPIKKFSHVFTGAQRHFEFFKKLDSCLHPCASVFLRGSVNLIRFYLDSKLNVELTVSGLGSASKMIIITSNLVKWNPLHPGFGAGKCERVSVGLSDGELKMVWWVGFEHFWKIFQASRQHARFTIFKNDQTMQANTRE